MTPEERKAARERCEKASAGMWYKETAGCCGPAGTVYRVGPIQFTDRGSMGENNADFVVHARTDLPAALDQIDDYERLMRESMGSLDIALNHGGPTHLIYAALDALRARLGDPAPESANTAKCPVCGEVNELPPPDGSVFQVMTCGGCGAEFDYDERGPLRNEAANPPAPAPEDKP